MWSSGPRLSQKAFCHMRDFNFGQIDGHLPESSKVFDLRSIFMKIVDHFMEIDKTSKF
jgi:hypothetical protein